MDNAKYSYVTYFATKISLFQPYIIYYYINILHASFFFLIMKILISRWIKFYTMNHFNRSGTFDLSFKITLHSKYHKL